MAAAGAVSLWLGDFGDVDERRDVVFARDFGGGCESFEQGGVIPGADGVVVIAALGFFGGLVGVALEPAQDFADVFFDHLELVRHRNAVAVIVDG